MDDNLAHRANIVIVGRPDISEERRSRPFTALELERMGSDSWFELIKGRLYETWPLDFYTSAALTVLFFSLYKHVHTEQLGHVLGGVGFVIERSPDTVIAPRGAFVRKDRIPDSGPPHGFFPGAPDLAIEAASSLDSQADLERKRELYERLPVPLLWWIDPERRTATVQREGRSVRHLTENDFLDGENIVPSFSFQFASLFEFESQLPNG
jgi:Uma2 family endonuclease